MLNSAPDPLEVLGLVMSLCIVTTNSTNHPTDTNLDIIFVRYHNNDIRYPVFHIKYNRVLNDSSIHKPKYVLHSTNWSGSNQSDEVGYADAEGTTDTVSWFNHEDAALETLPPYWWSHQPEFIIRLYDISLGDPVVTVSFPTAS